MPSREEMLKKLRRQDMIDRLRNNDAKTTPPVEDKPWYKSAYETFQDFSDKAQEATSFGLRDELAGVVGAGMDKIVRGKEGSFSDLYEQNRDDERLRSEQSQKRSPIASGLGTVVGSVVSPNPVGKVKGLSGLAKAGGALGAEGALTGIGYSDADLNSTEALADAGLGGVINVALPGAGALAKRGVSKIAPEGVTELLRKTAQQRATKAATGNQSKYSEPLRRKGRIEERGKVLLDEGIMDGSPSAAQISERAEMRSREVGKEIEGILSKVDEIEPSAVSAREVADKIVDYASSKEAPKNKAFVNNLLEQASEFESMGNIPMAEAQRLKRQYKWDDRDPAVQALGPEATNKINRILSDALETSVEKVEKKAGDEISGLLDQYKQAKNRYGHLAGAAESSEKLASRQDKNRTFSLSDYLTGLGLAGTTGYGSQDTATGLGVGAGAALVNRALRRRGSAAASRGLTKAANASGAINQGTKPLQAVMTEGRPALAGTRAILDATDKDYQELINERLQRSEEEKKKAKLREILRDYYQLQRVD